MASAGGVPRFPPTKVGQNRATQRGGGGFPVGARDGHDGRIHEPRRQLQLAGDEGALRSGGFDLRHGRHTGREHDDVGAQKQVGRVATQHTLDSRRYLRQLGLELVDGLCVVDGHRRAVVRAQPGRRDAGSAKTDDDNAFASEIAGWVHQRTFKVRSSPTMAQKKETIQKRTTIRDSGQPFFSKW